MFPVQVRPCESGDPHVQRVGGRSFEHCAWAVAASLHEGDLDFTPGGWEKRKGSNREVKPIVMPQFNLAAVS
jgi:hypothetical protein